MIQETIVRLKIISGTRSPEMITEAIGLQCDKWWHYGDKREHTIIVEKNNGWVLHSGLPRTASLDEHIDALWRILEPVKAKIRCLASTELVELSCVIYSSFSPALYFECSVINRLAELGAGMDIDLYRLPDDKQ
jgi:hypothetical protein